MKLNRNLLAATFALSAASRLLAVDFHFNAPAGNWNDPAVWSPAGPPAGGGGNFAFVSNGGTATVDANTAAIQDPFIGRGGVGTGIGHVNQTAGHFNASAGWTFIGTNGNSTGSWTMSGASSLDTGRIYAGSGVGANGTFNVNTTGAVTMGSDLIVGENGGNGIYNQTSGTVTSNGWTYIGIGGTANATVSGGTLNANNRLYVGVRNGGNGVLNVTGTGVVNTGEAHIGDNTDWNGEAGTGTLNVSGGSFTANTLMQVGRLGAKGFVNQTGGAVLVTNGWFGIGNDNALSAGSKYTQSGGTFTSQVGMEIGADTQGSYELSGTGILNANSNVHIGFRVNGNGTFQQDGGTFNANAGEIRVGSNAGSTGAYNMSGGTANLTGFLQVGASGTGTLNQTGGVINNLGWMVAGRFGGGNGTMNIAGGSIIHNTDATSIIIGEEGTGILNIADTGLVHVNSNLGLRIGHIATGNGTINLFDGGTLATQFILKTNAAAIAKINFNGGTLKALASSGDFLQQLTAAELEVQGGGLKFDSNGNTVVINQDLTGAGGLTKLGGGTLALTGANNYTGPVLVSAGTLAVTQALNSAAPTITVDEGATLDASGPGLTLAGGQVLSGKGTILGLLTTGAGSTVAPGASPGILTLGSGVTFGGGTLSLELDGITPGTLHDQLDVTGAVNLVTATALNLLLGYAPANGDSFVIINNDGVDPVLTAALFTSGGDPIYEGVDFGHFGSQAYSLSYASGSASNDVVLNVVPEPGSIALLVLGAATLLRRRRKA